MAAEQAFSFWSFGLRVGHWTLPPPLPRRFEQFFWMFQGLPPMAAALFATMEF
jgi:hypothetical protein